MTRAGVGVSSRSRRPTRHLWCFDARRDARLASRPKGLALWHAAGLSPPSNRRRSDAAGCRRSGRHALVYPGVALLLNPAAVLLLLAAASAPR